jgi:hypothetical protein
VPASQEGIGVEQRGKTGRAKVDERGQSVWEFVDDSGKDSTVSTARVLSLGDELSLAATATHPAMAKPATPKVEPPPVPGKPPRKPMSRQELQKLSDEIVRQRKLREAQAKK